jgi:hypothetical protein
LFFWGGQSENDAEDYYILADLVEAGKLKEAESHYWLMDTAARDPMHEAAPEVYSAIFQPKENETRNRAHTSTQTLLTSFTPPEEENRGHRAVRARKSLAD